MDPNQRIVLIAAVIAVVVAAAMGFVASRRRRSRKLRQTFGPEYDRVVGRAGDSRNAEGVLEFRQYRRERFHIRRLTGADRSSFAVRWNEVQARFVDDARRAVTVADGLVTDVIETRGYPIDELDQRAADLSIFPLTIC